MRIGTRGSQLALWQAQHVAERLHALDPAVRTEIIVIKTKGDKILDVPLAKIGGKGLFVKEIEEALYRGEVDLAVHSLKDVPVEQPEGLTLAAFLEREDPRDAFVSNTYDDLTMIPAGGKVGSASLRRQAQVLSRFPHLQVEVLRGNVNTRLAKLDAGEYDAILLAASGLKRLGFHQRIRKALTPEECLPAIGQGVLALEVRTDQPQIQALAARLQHPETTLLATAERAMNQVLQGGCQTPIGAYAELLTSNRIRLRAFVASPDGRTMLRAQADAGTDAPEQLGREVAELLLAQGAKELLQTIHQTP